MEAVTFVMTFAAIPYIVSACILVVLIRRSHTLKQLIWISMAAPILMGILMVTFFAAIDPPELRGVSRLMQLSSVFPISAIVGYCYVALAWIGFAIGVKWGLVGGEAPNACSRTKCPLRAHFVADAGR